MKKILSVTLVLFMALTVSAQKDVKFTINHFLGSNAFAFNAEGQNDLSEKFKVQRLEYYISGISIVHDGGKITTASDIYILVQADQKDTIKLGNFDITNIEAINFSVGVDPGVNNADPAQWGAGHALAPKNPSMHWGWAGGYRFVALEAKSGSNFLQEFQIHALGNKNYFKQNIPVQGVDVNGALVITLNADYAKSVSGIGMDKGLVEHSEDNAAIVCLRNFQNKVFTNTSGEGNTLSFSSFNVPNAFTIYPNPACGSFNLEIEDKRFQKADIKIVNVLGVTVLELNAEDLNQEINLNTAGVYWLSISKDGLVSTEKFIIQ